MYYVIIGVNMSLISIAVFVICVALHMRKQRRRTSITVYRRRYHKEQQKLILRNKRLFLEKVLTEMAKQRFRWELVHLGNFNGVPYKRLFPPNYQLEYLEKCGDGVYRPVDPLKGLISH